MKAQREMDTRFYAGLYDLLRRRIALAVRGHDRCGDPLGYGSGVHCIRPRGHVGAHIGPNIYDPKYDHRGELGGGRTCSKCRRIVRYDVRVCPSCGTLD